MKKLRRYFYGDFGFEEDEDGILCTDEDVTKLEAEHAELLEALDNALKLITSLTGPDDEIAQTVIREGMDAIKKARGEL